jgi:hypothetical protein
MPNSPIELRYDRGTLILGGVRGRANWQYDPRIDALRTHAIGYSTERADLVRAFGDDFRDCVPVPPRLHWPKLETATLRSEQQMAVDAWNAAGGRGMVVMPTGTGKTEVALAFMPHTRSCLEARRLGRG